MQFLLKVLLTSCLFIFSYNAFADDVWLYDSSGNPSVVYDESGSNIFSSSGQPLGYVSNGAVYSYSGSYLGWYSDGVLWDKNGYMVAFSQAKRPETIQLKTDGDLKIVKETTIPVKVAPTEVVTTPPTYIYQVSPTPLNTYFSIEPAN